LKVQILKGTEEHQVQSSFVGITVVAPLDSVQGTHSTLEVELRTYNPHGRRSKQRSAKPSSKR
jgi:hypothetical protein